MTSQISTRGLKNLPRGKMLLKHHPNGGESYSLTRLGSLWPRWTVRFVFESDKPLKSKCDGKVHAGMSGTLYSMTRPVRTTEVDLLILEDRIDYWIVAVRPRGWFDRVFDPDL